MHTWPSGYKVHTRREIRTRNISWGSPAQVRILSYAIYIMEYICGECGGFTEVKVEQAVLCNFCGSRILYKPRTKQILEYEAR